MAMSDYRLCDVCGQKAFYDASLDYRFDPDDPRLAPPFRVAGALGAGMSLNRLGDWAVICCDCAKTHKCVVVELDASAE